MAGKGIPILNRFKRDPETMNLVSDGGFQMSVVQSLQQKLNFRFNITENSFGSKQENGLFNGMIGEVQAGRIEMGVGAASTLDRYEVVHFLTANTIQFIQFVTPLPKARTKWQAIFRSFTPNSWSFIFITCYCFLFPAFIFSYFISHHFKVKVKVKVNGREGRYILRAAVGEGLGFIMRPLLEQPFSRAQMLRSGGGTVLLGAWMFSAIIFGTAYKSILMSNMVTPLTEEVPDTYADLAAAKDYKIYLHYVGGTLPKLFGESRSSVFQDLSRRFILEKSIFKCIKYALNSKAACLSYRDNIGAEVNRNFSDRYGNLLVRKASDTAFNLPVSILIPKTALYKEAMNWVVRQQVDMGLTEYYVNYELKLALDQGKKWAKVRPDAVPLKGKNGLVTLSIEHFVSNFSLLALGSFLGSLSFVMELMTKKRQLLRSSQKQA
jgi:hypothetical protein